MPIQVETDRLVELSHVPNVLEKQIGKRLNLATIYRWRQRGIAGIRLETILIGGRAFTSMEALQSFFQQSVEAKHGNQAVATSAEIKRSRLSSEKRLEAEAKELGI